MPPKRTKSAGGVVVNREGLYLVVSQHGNSWSLPKGKLDAGENTLAAARREIREESGVKDLEFIADLGHYERPRISLKGGDCAEEIKEIHMFLFTTKTRELKPEDPHNPEARWVTEAEMLSMLTHEKDRQFFATAVRRTKELLK